MEEVEAVLLKMVSHRKILDKSGLSTTDNAYKCKLISNFQWLVLLTGTRKSLVTTGTVFCHLLTDVSFWWLGPYEFSLFSGGLFESQTQTISLLLSSWWKLLLVKCNKQFPCREIRTGQVKGESRHQPPEAGSRGKEGPAASATVKELWASGVLWWEHQHSMVSTQACTQRHPLRRWQRTLLCCVLHAPRIGSLLRACSCKTISHPNFVASLWILEQMDCTYQLKSTVD